MATARSHRRATHRPPNAASMRGLREAMKVLYGSEPPMQADEHAQVFQALQDAPYEKRQADLALAIPAPEVP